MEAREDKWKSRQDRCGRCGKRSGCNIKLSDEVVCEECIEQRDLEPDDWTIPEDY